MLSLLHLGWCWLCDNRCWLLLQDYHSNFSGILVSLSSFKLFFYYWNLKLLLWGKFVNIDELATNAVTDKNQVQPLVQAGSRDTKPISRKCLSSFPRQSDAIWQVLQQYRMWEVITPKRNNHPLTGRGHTLTTEWQQLCYLHCPASQLEIMPLRNWPPCRSCPFRPCWEVMAVVRNMRGKKKKHKCTVGQRKVLFPSALAELRKATISFVIQDLPICPYKRPCRTALLQLGRFSWNLIFYFSWICR